MPDTPQIQISQYEDAIASKIRERFPVFNTVKAFPEERLLNDIVLPACVFEITELEAAPTHDGGSGQTPVDVRVEMHLLFSFKTPNIKRMLPAIAANVLSFMHLQHWGLRCEPCQILGASPDTYDPALEQFALWRIEFHQVLDLGDSVWATDPGWHPPTQVFITGTQPMVDGHPSLAPTVPEYGDPWLVQKAEDASILEWLG